MKKAVLYVCATPIGHLGDCSERLIETLRSVDRIAAEDTRHSLRLLQRFDITNTLVSLEKFNERRRASQVLYWLGEGESIALVSDAGTPTVSDPGAHLVGAVREAGFDVVPIPGPSAVVALLSVAGLETDQFVFGGFLPRKTGERVQWFSRYRQVNLPIVFYESPKRLIKSLKTLAEEDTGATVFLGKEITKQFETFFSGSIASVLETLEAAEPLKGEWCGLIIPSPQVTDDSDLIQSDIDFCREQGLSDQQIRSVLAEFRGHKANQLKKSLYK